MKSQAAGGSTKKKTANVPCPSPSGDSGACSRIPGMKIDGVDQIREAVDQKLATFHLDESCHPGFHSFLVEARRLLMSRAAKRVRGIIPVLVAKSRSQESEPCLSYGVVIELLHFTSLVHDDVIDQHDTRRGRSTLNSVFSNSSAVLTGDYIVYEVIKHCLSLDYGPKVIELAIRAAKNMVAGIVLEQDVLSAEPSLTNYLEMARLKTGSLFALSFGLPFIAEEHLAQGLECGELFGTIFQIHDDYLDRHQDKDCENIFKIMDIVEIKKVVDEHTSRMNELGRSIGADSAIGRIIKYLEPHGYFRDFSTSRK